MQIKLKNVRLSFPSLFRKAVFNGDETKYEATFLINKSDPIVKEIQSEINRLIKEDLKGSKLAEDRICFKDGDDIEYEGYKGCYSIKAANKKRPMVIDRDRTPLSEDDNRIYAGCYVNAIIELWVQNNAYGKRINANLHGVQFFSEGEPFGNSPIIGEDAFDSFDDEF